MLFGCSDKEKIHQNAFYDNNGAHIGDSIYVGGLIQKVIMRDTAYFIDSIVFDRYKNARNTLKSIYTYKAGRQVLQNIDYYENRRIKKYAFIDEDQPSYRYERLYSEEGIVQKVRGYLFFQGFVSNVSDSGIDVKLGTDVQYKIYYPNPPDCKVELFVEQDDGALYNVFRKSKYIDFLQTVANRNNSLGVYESSIHLHLKDPKVDTIAKYNHSFIFKVVP